MVPAISPSLRWILKHAWENNRPDAWNCYGCQASDGDNYGADNDGVAEGPESAVRRRLQLLVLLGSLGQQAEFNSRWSDYAQALLDMPKKYLDLIYVGRMWDEKTLIEQFRAAFTKRTAKQKQ